MQKGLIMGITMIGVLVILAFAVLMWAGTTIYKKQRGSKLHQENNVENLASKKDADESTFEKYCNDKKNDNYKVRANWILTHDKNERESRGQKD